MDSYLPTSNLTNALLTDMYQISMAYSYFKNNKHNNHSVFELFFRTCPFKGQYVIFGGIDEVLKFVQNFKFTQDDVNYIKSILPHCDETFLSYLLNLDTSKLTLKSMKQGEIVFGREPLIVVEGPLALCQLLETTLLNLVNFPSLIATNASRLVSIEGDKCTYIEMGLRRAQGPDGAISATKYSYIGGFDGTSNVLAGKLFKIPCIGTMAHAYVQSYLSLDDIQEEHQFISSKDNSDIKINIIQRAKDLRQQLNLNTNEGELAAFLSYAFTYPSGFLALVDTYETLSSGVPNFLIVAKILAEAGYTARGIRLDSGDLSLLSFKTKELYQSYGKLLDFDTSTFKIVASNDINEQALEDIKKAGHCVDIFGVGTHLVTCQKQPALGCVYKLVDIMDHPRIKLSQQLGKMTIPFKKQIWRIYGQNNDEAVIDVMTNSENDIPQLNKEYLCRHPSDRQKRVIVTPSKIENLHITVFENGQITEEAKQIQFDLQLAKKYASRRLKQIPKDCRRLDQPKAYKVSISNQLYNNLIDLWEKESIITRI